ncbi:MAG: trimethylamine methyltransferase family protein [Archaeoglobaceae archaeon]
MKRGPKIKIHQLLSPDEVEAVHNAALDVLRDTGVDCYSNKIMDVFEEAGADVDREKRRVRIPEHLITEAIRKAPSKILFCGRNPENDILLETGRIYYGYGGTPTPMILDHRTDEYRRPTKQDMIESTLVGDALPNMDFMMSNAGVFDVPYEVEYLHEFDVLFNYTEKPILYSAPNAHLARKFLEMGTEIAGSLEELQKRPFMSLYTEPASPLMLTESQENIIDFAEANIPIALGPMPTSGGTAPGTAIGSSVIGTSETLAGLTLAQLANPHAPVIYGGWGLPMDPKTGVCAYGSPEFAMGANTITSQMAEFYGMPSYGFGGCSDGKAIDSQSGAEAMLNIIVSGYAGINLIHDCGYLAGGMVGSAEQAVITDEMINFAKRLFRGVQVDDDHLAVDVINEIGPGGYFISHKHTIEHVHEFLTADLFDRGSFDSWKNKGKKSTRDSAKERVEKILKEHKPQPLSKEVKEKFAQIIKEEEKRLVKA